MKKLLIVFLLFLLPVAIGCFNKNKPESDSMVEDTDTREVFQGSWFDLVKHGKDYKCEFAVTNDGQTMTSKAYVHKKKVKSTIIMPEMTQHSLVDGDWLFSWSDQNKQGMKMNLNEFKDDEGVYEQDKYDESLPLGTADPVNDYEFKCEPWQVDDSVFELPDDVSFVDWGAQIKKLQAQMEAMDLGDEFDITQYEAMMQDLEATLPPQ